MTERYLCIHCHFYQPPRENPWLEDVELQDSASPYHDWNERIAAECYVPNGASRILDNQGRITKIVNNYAHISFDFGPTLLSWMEDNAPWAYARILQADQESQKLFSGHGAALAQAYNHMILPLANSRDKYTQIEWGIRDFEYRFKRDPEGMWLPETAVDVESLELLCSLGIKFTLLAPHQARHFRHQPWEEWIPVEGGGIDPTRAYSCYLPSGQTLSLFFYDGPISRAVAFEQLLSNGENFAKRLLGGFSDQRCWPQLVHIATDGETYGHHHARGDMALAYALDYVESNHLARITNYGEFLAQCPPLQEVEIQTNSSWSCCHGVARWESDCGCNSGGHGGWNQHWRRPLREALDWLRDELAPKFEEQARDVLSNPWAARNDYIRVVLDRSPGSVDAYLARHATRELSPEEQIEILKLLEMQRHLMLMYTSCGWFFDELSGLETLQILQYAARAVQLAEELFDGEWEAKFLERLERTWSNIPGFGNGRHIYDRLIRPSMLDLLGVGAHYAISSLFNEYQRHSSIYCYRVDLQEAQVLESGKARLAIGRARISSSITRARCAVGFGVLHLGDHHVVAGVSPYEGKNTFRAFFREAVQAFSHADLPECVRVIDRCFPGATYSLRSLFRDEQRRVVSKIVDSTVSEADALYRQVYEHHAPLMHFLSELHIPLPPILRATSEFVIGSAVRQALAEGEVDIERARMLLSTATQESISLDVTSLEFALRERLNALMDQWSRNPGNLQVLETVESLLSLARSLPFDINLWKPQNVYYGLLQHLTCDERTLIKGAADVWLDHFLNLAEGLQVALPAGLVGWQCGAAPSRRQQATRERMPLED